MDVLFMIIFQFSFERTFGTLLVCFLCSIPSPFYLFFQTIIIFCHCTFASVVWITVNSPPNSNELLLLGPLASQVGFLSFALCTCIAPLPPSEKHTGFWRILLSSLLLISVHPIELNGDMYTQSCCICIMLGIMLAGIWGGLATWTRRICFVFSVAIYIMTAIFIFRLGLLVCPELSVLKDGLRAFFTSHFTSNDTFDI